MLGAQEKGIPGDAFSLSTDAITERLGLLLQLYAVAAFL